MLEQVRHQVRLERYEDGAAIASARLAQVPDHDVGIGDVDKAEGLGVSDVVNRHPRAP